MRDAWFHVIFSNYGTWLRGDRRGFRDHDHRIHSSGDYRNPPPPHEHAGLRRWCIQVMHKNPVRLSAPLRERVGKAVVVRMRELEVRMIAIAVLSDHVHLQARLPHATARKLVGLAKARASHRIRDAIPGVVFAKKCKLEPIRDRAHHLRVFSYIREHLDEGGWVWTFRDPVPKE